MVRVLRRARRSERLALFGLVRSALWRIVANVHRTSGHADEDSGGPPDPTQGDGAAQRTDKRSRIQRVLTSPGEPSIVFQPIIDITTQELVGVEALSRFGSLPERPPDLWFAEAAAVGLGEELELAAIRGVIARISELPMGYLSVQHHPSAKLLVSGLRSLSQYPEHGAISTDNPWVVDSTPTRPTKEDTGQSHLHLGRRRSQTSVMLTRISDACGRLGERDSRVGCGEDEGEGEHSVERSPRELGER